MFPYLQWPIYSTWSWNTPVIPNFYWNAYSMEQRFKNLCLNQGKMTAYLDEVAENVNEWAEEVQNKIEDFSDFATEQGYDELVRNTEVAKNNNFFIPRLLGRLVTDNFENAINPQSMCLLDDTTVIMTQTNSDTTNKAYLIKVDLINNVVVEMYSTMYGHCNGICYNEENEKIYVPVSSDYSNGNKLYIIYICNKDTMQIEQTIDTSNYDLVGVPHSMCYDKITKKMYMTTYLSGDVNLVRLYEFDYNNIEFNYLCVIPVNIKNNYDIYGQGILTGGTQNIHSYNGELFYLMGGANTTAILHIDTKGNLIDVIGVSKNMFIYQLLEAQGMDFTSNGDIIMCGRGMTKGNTGRYNLLFGINYNGHMLINMTTTYLETFRNYRVYVDGRNGMYQNILPMGTVDNPFPTADEAVGLAKLVNNIPTIYFVNTGNTQHYYLTAVDSLEFSSNQYIFMTTKNNILHLNNANMSIHNNVTFHNGTIVTDIEREYLLQSVGCTINLYQVELDLTNITSKGFYSLCSFFNVINTTITNNPNNITLLNGRNSTQLSIYNSPLFTYENLGTLAS